MRRSKGKSDTLLSFFEENLRHKLSSLVNSSINPFVTESTKEWIWRSRNAVQTPEDHHLHHQQNMLVFADENVRLNIKVK